MADIRPSSFNPFTEVSKAIGAATSRGMNFHQSAAMVQMHHASAMEQLYAGHQLAEQSAKSEYRRNLAKQRISHQQAMDLETHKAGLAAQGVEAQHKNTMKAAKLQAGLAEKGAALTHGRNIELLKGLRTAAQPGTRVDYSSGDVRLGFTAKQSKPKAATPVTPAAETPAAPEAAKQKFAHRDPVTKKITGYFDHPQGPLKAVKKASPKKKK